MVHSCGPLAVEIFPRKHCDFSTYLAKGARAQSGECAAVHFFDNGTELCSSGSRNISKKSLRFQHLSCQDSESSSAAYAELHILIMVQSCGPLAVERFPRKHCDFSTYLAKRARAQSGT
jgi:hypothetical protein